MSKNLVIVESPAKAKTIEGFLGKDFIVKSCFGHIRDLVKKGFGVEIENNFNPTYEVSADKVRVISELKKISQTVETVWLASDEDREGEAISWHLYETLGLKKANTKRIVFHEITKPAILKAIETPRSIDINLVNAQQARRILDRLVGFELSPILWKKVRPQLSAGRVQSVTVRLIVDREREIQKFNSTSAYKIVSSYQVGSAELKAELDTRFKLDTETEAFLNKCKNASFSILDLEKKPTKRSPAAPFTTSTLQQEAARKLGFSVAQTMLTAQRLYEAGKITYMRTDSVNLSETALKQMQTAIESNYGKQYYNRRQYKNKSKNAQEAHEAIRPTYIDTATAGVERNEQRLYELIWKRTIASQMSDAELEKTTAKIKISTTTEQFIAQGEILKFDGFLKVYMEGTDDENTEDKESILPPLKVGETLTLKAIVATQRFTHHPARYTEASLVKKLEELGIGRPSTYAPTISTVQKRNYVEKKDKDGNPRSYQELKLQNGQIKKETKTENTGAEKSKLFPTDIGCVVNDFLIQYFPNILDFHFTAKVEEEFDEIADGNLSWQNMLKNFYTPFHKTIQNTNDTSERASGEKILGKDSTSGLPVSVRVGRYGPLAQIGVTSDKPDAPKPKFASLLKSQSIETITLAEALDLFKLPLTVGMYQNKEVIINIGRFGPYVKLDEQFISIPRTIDPFTIDLEQAIQIIKEKEAADAPIATYQNKPVTKGKGRFGPFIKFDGMFINVPRAYNFDALSQKDINELIEKKIEKESNRYIQNWSEEKISIENGRWGPFIKFGKLMYKLTDPKSGSKISADDATTISLDQTKVIILAQNPKAFDTKKGAAKKSISKTSSLKIAANKKPTPVKAATKSKASTVKKAATKKKLK